MSGVKSALVVANSHYEHTGLRQLTAPKQDASAMAQALAAQAIEGFEFQPVAPPKVGASQ